MYVRKLGEDEITFGVSGALWRDSLIMYDRKTESYWSQVAGRAIWGEANGAKLDEYPSVVTTWGEWKARHPETLVLEPGERFIGKSRYEGYFSSPDRLGVFGSENPDGRLGGKEIVLGVELDDDRVAILAALIAERGVVTFEAAGRDLAAVRTAGDDARVFDTRVGERRLSLYEDDAGDLRDRETGTTWDRSTGRALEGELVGETLAFVPARRGYWFVWASFHEDSRLILPENTGTEGD